MLTLARKKGEEIVIGEDIVITVKELSADSVKLSVKAPRDVPVFRRELLQAVQENREAAVSDEDSAAGLAALLSSGKNQCRTGKLKETSREGDNDK